MAAQCIKQPLEWQLDEMLKRRLLAGSRQWVRQLASRIADTRARQLKPQLSKLDGHLDRRLMADCRLLGMVERRYGAIDGSETNS